MKILIIPLLIITMLSSLAHAQFNNDSEIGSPHELPLNTETSSDAETGLILTTLAGAVVIAAVFVLHHTLAVANRLPRTFTIVLPLKQIPLPLRQFIGTQIPGWGVSLYLTGSSKLPFQNALSSALNGLMLRALDYVIINRAP